MSVDDKIPQTKKNMFDDISTAYAIADCFILNVCWLYVIRSDFACERKCVNIPNTTTTHYIPSKEFDTIFIYFYVCLQMASFSIL